MSDDKQRKIILPISTDSNWLEWFGRWLRNNVMLVVLGLIGWAVVLFTY